MEEMPETENTQVNSTRIVCGQCGQPYPGNIISVQSAEQVIRANRFQLQNSSMMNSGQQMPHRINELHYAANQHISKPDYPMPFERTAEAISSSLTSFLHRLKLWVKKRR